MFLRYNFYSFLWGLLILVLSLLPGKALPSVSFWDLLSFDKAMHMFFYAVFVFLISIGFTKQYTFHKLRYHIIRYALLIGVIYGAFIEIFQGLIMPDRFADMMDFFANFIGCILGGLAFNLVYFGIKRI